MIMIWPQAENKVADLAAASARDDEMGAAAKGVERAPAELTPRQWEILNLVARGMTYKEIAAALHLTEEGVKYHMLPSSIRIA